MQHQLVLFKSYHNFVLPHASLRQSLLVTEVTDGSGSARLQQPCTSIVTRLFPTTGDWTRTAFASLCRVIVEAGHMELAAEDDMRSCRFCGRGTNLWVGTQFAAPNFCDPCMDVLQEWNARGYLRLLEARDRR